MPDVVGIAAQDAPWLLGLVLHWGLRRLRFGRRRIGLLRLGRGSGSRGLGRCRRLVAEAGDSSRTEVEPCPSQELGDAAAAEGGVGGAELLDEEQDELREAVDWNVGLDETRLAGCFDAVVPGTDGSRGERKAKGGVGLVPAASGLEGKDGETLVGTEVRSVPGRYSEPPGVLEPKLFAEQGDLLGQSVPITQEAASCTGGIDDLQRRPRTDPPIVGVVTRPAA
jgi:hypothetical protein